MNAIERHHHNLATKYAALQLKSFTNELKSGGLNDDDVAFNLEGYEKERYTVALSAMKAQWGTEN